MIVLIRKLLRRRPRVSDPVVTFSYAEMTKDAIKISPETVARYAKFKMEQMG